MTFRKPLIAAIIAAVLFGVYLLDRQQSIAREKIRVRVGRIMPFDFINADRLIIENEIGRFVIEKESDETWMIVEPRRLRADEERVRTIIDNVHASKKSNPFPVEDLAEYGLNPPTARVVIEGTDSETGESATASLRIGGDSPRLSRIYAMVEGENTIFTTLDTLRNQTRVDLSDLRDRRFLRFRPDSVNAFEVQLPSGSFRIVRSPRGEWMLDDNVTPANNSMIAAALNQLSQARAIRILEGDELPETETSGLDSPAAARIRVEVPTETFEAVVGNRADATDSVYVKGSALEDAVGVIRAREVGPFLQAKREWITPRFLWARPDEIERIEIRPEGTQGAMFAVERGDDGVWRFEDQPDSPVHPARIETLVRNLSQLTGKQLITDSASADQQRELYGLHSFMYELVAVMPDGRTEGYKLGKTEARELNTYLLRVQDSNIWTIDSQTLHLYRALRGDLRDNRIKHGYAASVESVVFSTASGSVTLAREQRSWRLIFSDGRRQVVPDHLVEQFFHASEELSRSAEVFSSTHPPVEFELTYRDATQQGVHKMGIHRGDGGEEGVFVSVGEVLYDAIPESFIRFQRACDELLLTGQQLAEQQK